MSTGEPKLPDPRLKDPKLEDPKLEDPKLEDPKQYLLDYLREEFDRYPQVRLRIVPPSQDDGVSARTETREYFFPTDWVRFKRWDQVRALTEKIKDFFF